MPTDRADDSDAGGPGDTLSPQESLDSDDVRNNDGDDVVDPPDQWIEARDDETLDERLAAEVPDTSVAASPRDPDVLEEGIAPAEYGVKHAEIVDGVIVEDSRVDRGQIDGTPEDGDSFFDVQR